MLIGHIIETFKQLLYDQNIGMCLESNKEVMYHKAFTFFK